MLKLLSILIFGHIFGSFVTGTTADANITESWRPKILITDMDMPEIGLNILKKKCDVILCETNPAARSEILSKVSGIEGLIWKSSLKLDNEILEAAGPQLKSISCMSEKYEKIDIIEITRRGIPIGYTPTVASDAIADMAIGLMIAAARRFHEGRLKIEQSQWESGSMWMLGQDLTLKTFGIVGLGDVGETIARRLSGFTKPNQKPKVIYSDNSINTKESELGACFVKFDELVEKSDIVFITDTLNLTSHLFNEKTFKKMKPTSVLINIARANIVDQEALYNALKDDIIFAAGLDVTKPEPLPHDHPLMKLPNCIITPHISSATGRARNDTAFLAAINLLKGLAGEPMLTPIPLSKFRFFV